MVAHHCFILLLHSILPVNFMMIESTNQISPAYYSSRTFPHSFVKTVNTLKTYNEREIQFCEKEITILTNPVQTYNDTKGRDKVFDKFDTKVQDIICTLSLIVKTKLEYLTNILDGLRSGGALEVAMDKLTVLKAEAGIMVLLFQSGKVKAGKWFWSYFFKILAIIEYESNKHFFGETLMEEEELQSGIISFIKNCKVEKYLPKKITESDLVSKNPNVPKDIVKYLHKTVLGYYYSFGMNFLKIFHFYLKPFWTEFKLFFGKITGLIVEWLPTIRRHVDEVNKTKEYIENGQWISKPFGHLSYHELVNQIIAVRMYAYLWVMLVIFNREMPKMDVNRIDVVYNKTKEAIEMVQEFMPHTDTFFSDVIAAFHYAMHEDLKNFDSIISRISVRVKDILVELNGRNSNGSDWISIDTNEEFSDDMKEPFLHEFGNNFNLLRINLMPLNYALVLSFLAEGK
ncbi:uncharacterized protein LOC126839854 [Adelges cooleyi]|uniref:uncharacterized protein LOC126839854 n=1 Tax=Adelges cooleyi TaxID=133065 RepID=UPI00217FEF9C|nr:uncharacterized protein LOC126839854 [Adelges cooleyi]